MHDASRTRTPLQRATVFFFYFLCLPPFASHLRLIYSGSLAARLGARTYRVSRQQWPCGWFIYGLDQLAGVPFSLFIYHSTPVLIAINTYTPEFVTHRYKHTYKDDKFSAGYRLIDLWKLVTISLFPYRVDLDRWFLPVFGKPI